jgi:PTH1 family peptidyl-tRNA hydrolase
MISKCPKLIIGLGNPGPNYAKTRHNLGFQVVEALATASGLSFDPKKKLQAEVAKNNRVIIAKPITFMNESGKAMKTMKKFYKIANANLLVVHDEIDLPFGKIRISRNSGAAGHKGIESVIAAIGKKIARLRIGIENRRQQRIPPTEIYVLQNFTREEEKELRGNIIPKAVEEIKKFIE